MNYLMDDEKEFKTNPAILKYFQDKGQLAAPQAAPVSEFDQYQSQYGDEAMAKAQADADEQRSGLGWAQFAAGAGDALAGRSPSESAKNFEGIRKDIDQRTVGAFEKKKEGAIRDIGVKTQISNQQDQAARKDPNSAINQKLRASIMASTPALAKNMGENFNQITVDDYDFIMKPHQFAEQIRSREQQAKTLAGQRAESREQRAHERLIKEDEKMALLETPYGRANTPDDAKQLKEGHEAKKNFDSKLNEMIQLREKHKGGAILNRDDVGRGQQLSKDLLLEYKNMAKLGVLSQADQSIIEAIIPSDPLEYNSPLAAIQGQDPVLHKLKTFKKDSDNDFKNRVATRTRAGVKTAASAPDQTKDGAPPETKVVNGKTYTKVPGGWKAVNSVGKQ